MFLNLLPQASNLKDYVGYFLSPFDFLKECLTFFRFNAAFKRFVFFRLFILTSVTKSLSDSVIGSFSRCVVKSSHFRIERKDAESQGRTSI